MKKHLNDIILASAILIIAIIATIVINVTKKDDNLTAYIYYESDLIETVELSKIPDDDVIGHYVTGALGEVLIETAKNQIRIIESDCPDKDCIHQGWINSTSQVLVCVPNRIYIKLVSNDATVDVEV